MEDRSKKKVFRELYACKTRASGLNHANSLMVLAEANKSKSSAIEVVIRDSETIEKLQGEIEELKKDATLSNCLYEKYKEKTNELIQELADLKATQLKPLSQVPLKKIIEKYSVDLPDCYDDIGLSEEHYNCPVYKFIESEESCTQEILSTFGTPSKKDLVDRIEKIVSKYSYLIPAHNKRDYFEIIKCFRRKLAIAIADEIGE